MRIFKIAMPIFLLLITIVACKPQAAGDETAATTEAGTGAPYTIDAARSELRWKASKPSGTHSGLVPISEGSIRVLEGMITEGQVVIAVANLTVTDLEGQDQADLEGHLKGIVPGKETDFFNVQQFPTATFTVKGSSKIENDPDATHLIEGDLTIKDITKPVSFRAKVDTGAGDAIKVTTVPFTIDRTEWDIRFMSKKFFDNLKDDFVHDEIEIQITLGALKQG